MMELKARDLDVQRHEMCNGIGDALNISMITTSRFWGRPLHKYKKKKIKIEHGSEDAYSTNINTRSL